ncbi:carbamoyltransferase HypF [Uliginosibacterium sediminicola]|uniref:Carbamoyltransferase HypF n=1 Tax=Uliginosibacterium sediminicola TaxID=2024550 RepID=A0ABU9YVM2_9RHOO
MRERLSLRGLVQGVGFRPHVHRLASELGLSGWVRNDANGVTLEAQGSASALQALRTRLLREAPVHARIEACESEALAPTPDSSAFEIRQSEAASSGQAAIGADTCTCPACLAELFEPGNRRYRYAFINCTDCGPRYSIAEALPWDRARTSMAGFALCPDCAAEYEAPAKRRFHAEPNACPVCGPQLHLLDAQGQAVAGDAIAASLALIQRGGIVAIKSLGGFHLACDARNAAAVARLRARKQREEKPFAVMLANVASLATLAEISRAEQADLQSTARPIVLLRKRVGADAQLTGVAPDLAWLGVMLPGTPLHYLLFHDAAGRPPGSAWLDQAQSLALVMTSANVHGEPLISDNTEALAQLADITDAFLIHDRDIVIRCDDSVLRRLPGSDHAQFIRRARGYTPAAIPLTGAGAGTRAGANVLAVGGYYKNTLCFTRSSGTRSEAFLSQHIGDLDRVANCRALEAAVNHLQQLLQVKPQAIAHDLHPDFFSTQLALRLAAQWQVPAIAVQHHHAHIAAVLAEHQLDEPVLGLALDGVGLGSDGSAWGGELLRVDGAHVERLGHLQPIALPGGDRAARDPWRMGAAALAQLGRHAEIRTRFADQSGAALLAQMLERGTPMTTSMGRYFDAAAGLLGIQPQMSFEGQAAMRLEGLAASYGTLQLRSPLHEIENADGLLQLNLAATLNALLDSTLPVAQRAALFHAALIEALAEWAQAAADASGIRTLACAGGCFLNAILASGLRAALARRGLRMLEARLAPSNDGGLALGQAWVAQRALADSALAVRRPATARQTHPGHDKNNEEHSPCA